MGPSLAERYSFATGTTESLGSPGTLAAVEAQGAWYRPADGTLTWVPLDAAASRPTRAVPTGWIFPLWYAPPGAPLFRSRGETVLFETRREPPRLEIWEHDDFRFETVTADFVVLRRGSSETRFYRR